MSCCCEREMDGKSSPISVSSLATILSFLLLSLQLKWGVRAQMTPPRFDGLVYGETAEFNPENILIEAFFDPVCPDTRDAWPSLKQALHYYGSRLSLIVHPFPLPYHDNAFVTSWALHIVNGLNSSATYPLWESFFKHQEKFYNEATINMSRPEVVDKISDFIVKCLGHGYYPAVKSGFNDPVKSLVAQWHGYYPAVKSGFNDVSTEIKVLVSFKYGCSRGVFGTPSFFVNGFALPTAGAPVDYNGWRKIIDPLISSKEARWNSVFVM